MSQDDEDDALAQQALEEQEQLQGNGMKQLLAAFVKAQAHIEKASKDKANPHFRSKYADLGNVVDAIKPALEEHGLGFIQKFHDDDNSIKVETIIVHESGETLSCGVLSIPVSKRDAQGFGSACTYARRYSLQAAFGVAPEDDDGNAATQARPERKPPVKKAMTEDEGIDHLTAITSATTLQELVKAFRAAEAAAQGDEYALNAFTKAASERKAALQSQQEAA